MKNTYPKISVIVPVYGVEKYITKCINSLLSQTYTNFEALIINDGTRDNSITIAKEIIKNDPRFKIIHKENGGLSSARNCGIDNASGDFICFLDSDDYLDKSFLAEALNSMIKNQLDIVVTGMEYVSPTGEVLNKFTPNIKNYYHNDDVLLSKNSINLSACNKLYKIEVFNQKRFRLNIIFEDWELLPSLLYKKKIGSVDLYLYKYVQRSGSIIYSYNQKYIDSFFIVMESQKQFLEKNNIFEKHLFNYQIAYINQFFLRAIIYISSYSTNFKQDVKYLFQRVDKSIVNKNIIKKVYKNEPLKKMAVLLFLYSPNSFRILKYIKDKLK